MSSMQKKLLRSWDSFKDQTSVNIAKFAGNTKTSDLEISILKTTSHDEAPIPERYVQRILQTTSGSRVQVNACVASIAKRLRKTHNWIVAIKALMLIHRLLLDGDYLFQEALLSYQRHGLKILDLSKFRDDSSHASYYYTIFVRSYGAFLDGKINYYNRSVFKSSTSSAIVLYGHNVDVPGLDDRRNGYEHRHERDSRLPSLRDMRPVEVIERIPVIQQFLGLIFDCMPEGETRTNHMIHIALYLILRESFWIYSDLQSGLAIILDAFFDMDYSDSLKIYSIYVKVATQMDGLATFYNSCKDMAFCKPSEYPDVNGISKGLLETMKSFLNDKHMSLSNRYLGQNSRSSNTYYSSEPKDAIDYETSVVKALPAPHPVQEVGSASHAETGEGDPASYNIIGQQEVEKTKDLIEFGNEASDNEKPVVAGWELALMEIPSKPVSDANTLSGGLMLNTLYEQAIAEQRIASIIPSGSASSVSLPGKSASSSYLALPSSAMQSENDPFAASLSVAPPVYVQMADMSRKQNLLVQEQQQWYLYQQNGMQEYQIANQNNLKVSSFRPSLYGPPYH